jgi:hypothetical protein
LTALVLLLHWLVLMGAPGVTALSDGGLKRYFLVRKLPVLQDAAPARSEPVAAAHPAGRPAASVSPPKPRPQAHGAYSVPAPVPAPAPGAQPAAIAMAASTRLLYQVTGESKGLGYRAQSVLLWQQDGQRYDLRLDLGPSAPGSRTQTSTGSITPQGLAPTRFSDKVRGEQAAHFERDLGQVIFSANTRSAALLPGAQDRLSLLFQLAALWAGDPQRFPEGSTLAVQTVGAREAPTWLFEVGGSETLSLPGGELQGIRLTRSPVGEYDQRVELWLAPALGYLPVRLRLTQANGDWLDQQWRAHEAP